VWRLAPNICSGNSLFIINPFTSRAILDKDQIIISY
jgi:hypothetical protein